MFGAFLDNAEAGGAELEDVTLDLITGISYQLTGQATTDPVGREQTRQTDHWIDAPDVLTITAEVFDLRAGRARAPGRAAEIFRRLRRIKSDGQRVGFVAGLLVYPEVLITNVNTVEDGDHEDHLELTITIQEVDVAETLVEEIPPDAPDPDAAATKPTRRERQRQNTKDPAPEVKEKGSILYNAFFT